MQATRTYLAIWILLYYRVCRIQTKNLINFINFPHKLFPNNLYVRKFPSLKQKSQSQSTIELFSSPVPTLDPPYLLDGNKINEVPVAKLLLKLKETSTKMYTQLYIGFN